MYNRGLFQKWVPGILQLLLIMLFLILINLINSVNQSNVGQMVSSTGILAEYYMWGLYATIIGISIVLPFVLRIKNRFRNKVLLVTSLTLMAVLNVVIATTSIGEVVVAACLVFGVAKMICMLEFILPFRGIISPDGDNGRFYSVLYPITLGLSQFGAFISSKLALVYGWDGLHYYTAATLLIMAMIMTVLGHNQRFDRKLPFYGIDWLGVFYYITALMSMAYIYAFGKQQDWFNSPNIRFSFVAMTASIIALIIRQLTIKRPFLKFRLYRIREVRVGLLLLVAQGMYMGVGTVMSIYTSAILGYNWMINSQIGLMTIPGMLLAAFVAFHWTKHKIPLKMYIFLGFAAYFFYTVMLYFMMTPQLSITQLYLPQLLNGYGMCALFIAVWMYTLGKVPQSTDVILPSVAPVMIFRSFIIMGLFTTLFGWLHYKLQWQSVENLAIYFDAMIPAGVGALRDVQLGAVLAANKTLLGYSIVAGLFILTSVFFHQFGLQKYRVFIYRNYINDKRMKNAAI